MRTFSTWHTLRLSTFQIGSAMGDILVTSIWNQVMISNFGIPAGRLLHRAEAQIAVPD